MIPIMKRRRWPKRSPALPTSGATTPKASRGPVTTQVMAATLACRLRDTSGSATTKTVKSRLVASSPDSATHRTHQW